jgi:hypothetical protein
MESKYYIVLIRTADGKEYNICLDADRFNSVITNLKDETKTIIDVGCGFFFKNTMTLFKIIKVTDKTVAFENK